MKKLLSALWKAVNNMFFDLSFDIAGYIAYTSLLALFPFIMLLVSLAGYLGTTDAVQAAIVQLYIMVPDETEAAISPIINEIIKEQLSPSVLSGLIIAMLWISSSSVEAIREGLNHAYGIHEKRSVFIRRVQAILFVIVGSCAFLAASLVMIIMPLVYELWHSIEIYMGKIPKIASELGSIHAFSLLGAFLAIFLSMIIMYRWLPYHKIKLVNTIPGALICSGLWIAMAALFSLYLRSFGRYDLLYGSLGGIIITLVFFHLTAILILYGAHINRELYKD